MGECGLFDLEFRLGELSAAGDPLVRLRVCVPWEQFRPVLEQVRARARKSAAGRKSFDVVMMFKIMVLQSLYNLSDEATEYQLRDRLSFMRFVGLELGARVPDQKTIWLWREQLRGAGVLEQLFAQFEAYLADQGFSARKGQIIDASVVRVPRAHNSTSEHEQIQQGEVPAHWTPAQRRRKDIDARHGRHDGRTFYGYKNHVCIDVEHKLIRAWCISDAGAHEGKFFEPLLAACGAPPGEVWADTAYFQHTRIAALQAAGWQEHIARKGNGKHHRITPAQAAQNQQWGRVRRRIEHVFGWQWVRARGQLLLRSVGLARAQLKLGLRNLTYNFDRCGWLLSRNTAT